MPAAKTEAAKACLLYGFQPKRSLGTGMASCGGLAPVVMSSPCCPLPQSKHPRPPNPQKPPITYDGRACAGLLQPHKHTQAGGLARPVRAKEPEALPSRHSQVQLPHGKLQGSTAPASVSSSTLSSTRGVLSCLRFNTASGVPPMPQAHADGAQGRLLYTAEAGLCSQCVLLPHAPWAAAHPVRGTASAGPV